MNEWRKNATYFKKSIRRGAENDVEVKFFISVFVVQGEEQCMKHNEHCENYA